ncbi:hypothetical protein PsYK624_153320 [Phanerochaete sordida]|uniref:Uncharacterized protein n=1 Tax=Phanerochaete sordida TaxID=48140 RepID=A0A9P3GRM2_9APHY|nr:hypothetical protein PsYK624_153320 [Phanerochaete sordida]
MDGGGHLQLHAVPCLVPPPVRTSCQRSAILPPRSREYACNLRSCKQLKIHVPRSSMIKCPFHMIAAQVDAWISGIFRS